MWKGRLKLINRRYFKLINWDNIWEWRNNWKHVNSWLNGNRIIK